MEGNVHSVFKSFTLRNDTSTDQFWQNLASRQVDQQAVAQATSMAGTTIRMCQQHPVSIEEEIRLQRYARSHKLQKTGLFRTFDVKPPVLVDRPRKDGRGHHRANWSVDRLLREECDVFDEMDPIMSDPEKKLYNSLLADQSKTSQGTVTTNALKQHLVQRGLALNLKLAARRRPILTYLAEVLHKSDADPMLYTEELRALMIEESMALKEHEFHWHAGGHIKNPTPEMQTQFYNNVSRHFEEINLTKETDKKEAPAELLGTPTDVFEGVSANDWLQRQVAFCFEKPASSGNGDARSRGRKRKASKNGRGKGGGRGRGRNRNRNGRGKNHQGKTPPESKGASTASKNSQ